MRLRHAFLSLISGNVVVTAANLLRDITLAAAFGAAVESDVFFLAVSIPVFILTVASNAFRSVVVPALSRVGEARDTAFREVSMRFMWIAAVGTALVTVGLVAIAVGAYCVEIPEVSAGNRRLFALFLAAILPMYAGTSLVEFLQGPLQVTGKFLAPSLLKLGLPLGVIAGVLAFPHISIFSVSLGGTVGVLIALPIGLWLLHKDRMLPASRTVALPDGVRLTAVSGFKALVAATVITYANPLVDQWVAGLAGSGATSMLGYASRLMTGVVALVASAISGVLLIHFSRQVGDGDRSGISDTYRLLVRVMPWVGCLATLGVWLSSEFVVALLYQRGKFDAADVQVVADLVNRYALQFPFYWAGIAPVTLAWALSMNRIFVRIGLVLFLANVVGDLLFLQLFGVRGIPLSTTVVLVISITLVSLSLRNARSVDLSLADWGHATVPLSILAVCGMLIYRLDIGLRAAPSLADLGGAALMLAAFGVVALAVSLSAWRLYQAVPGRV